MHVIIRIYSDDVKWMKFDEFLVKLLFIIFWGDLLQVY